MGMTDLRELLRKMGPELDSAKYYFATVDDDSLLALSGSMEYIVSIFREKEGLTVVFAEDAIEELRGLSNKDVTGPFALITMRVQSDLMAVGFMAKLTEALGKENISVNVFSAYFHDYLFVPYERKGDAMGALKQLSQGQ